MMKVLVSVLLVCLVQVARADECTDAIAENRDKLEQDLRSGVEENVLGINKVLEAQGTEEASNIAAESSARLQQKVLDIQDAADRGDYESLRTLLNSIEEDLIQEQKDIQGLKLNDADQKKVDDYFTAIQAAKQVVVDDFAPIKEKCQKD